MLKQNVAFPYRLIPDAMVHCSGWGWSRESGGDYVQSTAVESWDYDCKLSISRTVEMNVQECLAAAGLDNGKARIGLVTILETGPAGYRWTGYQVQIPETTVWCEKIQIEIDSGKLASALKIYTDIVLLDAGARPVPMSATQAGSRLWGDNQQLDLEGSSARFPMDILDFRKALPHLRAPSARWYLYWHPDRLEGSFVGNVVLYLNSENKNFVSRVLANDPVLLTWIKSDIIRQLCSQLVESEEFAENFEDYEDDSVGGVVRSWFQYGFHDMKIDAVQSLYCQNRSWFEARLLSAFGGDDV